MKKKLVIAAAAAATSVAMLPLFAAFEAHVINVTARIENALAVQPKHIEFGTVFPQEFLLKDLKVELSGSFEDEDRVDDVSYIIRQKPKCGVTTKDGQTLVEGSTATGHVIPTLDNPDTLDVDESKDGTAYTIDCGRAPVEFNSETHMYGVLPMLCPYLSKSPDNLPDLNGDLAGNQGNDSYTPSFHWPFTVSGGQVNWLDTTGYLAKSQNDHEDNWLIDLHVPCFGNYCAQDWADYVHDANPNAGDADQWTQPISQEHKIYGCDLWVEVTGVSEANDDAPAPTDSN